MYPLNCHSFSPVRQSRAIVLSPPEPVPGRFGFIGEPAPAEPTKLYVNRRIPDEYRKPGSANPIKYTYR